MCSRAGGHYQAGILNLMLRGGDILGRLFSRRAQGNCRRQMRQSKGTFANCLQQAKVQFAVQRQP
jgi:hypothetical protein